MFNAPDERPDISVYYNYLFSLTEAAVDNTSSVGIPPHGYEDWAGHSWYVVNHSRCELIGADAPESMIHLKSISFRAASSSATNS